MWNVVRIENVRGNFDLFIFVSFETKQRGNKQREIRFPPPPHEAQVRTTVWKKLFSSFKESMRILGVTVAGVRYQKRNFLSWPHRAHGPPTTSGCWLFGQSNHVKRGKKGAQEGRGEAHGDSGSPHNLTSS